MNQLMLASHNSWSYLKPVKWWMHLLLPFSKCQSKSIEWQLENGVELFDLRIRFKPGGRLVVAHGLVEFDISEPELREHLSKMQHKSVRILLERRWTYAAEENRFKWWVMWAIENFPEVDFYGCRGAHGNLWWEKFVDTPDAPIFESHASVCGTGLQKFLPSLYAQRNNSVIRESWKNKNAYLMLDFVNI